MILRNILILRSARPSRRRLAAAPQDEGRVSKDAPAALQLVATLEGHRTLLAGCRSGNVAHL